ncbi:DUF2460 domain-containing protein [Bradyrhizobium sp. RT10b]|uniref:DUF2460 domain-containing protein n=1 Tax=Bradyrhizobium sp. RT10b TaxID=3156331 RepID=UPI0033930DD8
MTILTFPALSGLTWPVKKSPSFQTLKHKSVAGTSTMQSLQPYAIYAFELPFEFLRSDDANRELQQLMGLFQACRAGAIPFNFSDPDDNAVTGQTIGLGDGNTKSFGFVRSMGSVIDPVQNVIAAGLTVYDNGVPQILGTDYTLLATSQYGTNYGVQFATAPLAGHTISADFSYFWLCAFDDDVAEFSKLFNLNGKALFEAKSIKFSSVLQ